MRFDKDKLLLRIFDADFDVERIVHELEIARHVKIRPETTVILFDEIQACKNALTSLKYFAEDRPDLHVMAAGSLLGLAYRDGDDEDDEGRKRDDDEDETTGFPVGKVDTLNVYPLTFGEYLEATGEEELLAEIRQGHWKTLATFHDRLADMVRHYYVIGGMPEVVSAYVENKVESALLEYGGFSDRSGLPFPAGTEGLSPRDQVRGQRAFPEPEGL